MKKYWFILFMICCVSVANAQKPKLVDSAKIKKKLRADSIKLSNEIYTHADIMPSFPGGDGALKRYINDNMQYPTRDREDNRQGKVLVRFVIEKDGSISNIKSLTAPSTTMVMEAERLVKAMPKWRPGFIGDRIVRVQFTLAVNFSLQPY
ncbi:energy transducer TonB [Mucilaginibacter sp. AW1-3]